MERHPLCQHLTIADHRRISRLESDLFQSQQLLKKEEQMNTCLLEMLLDSKRRSDPMTNYLEKQVTMLSKHNGRLKLQISHLKTKCQRLRSSIRSSRTCLATNQWSVKPHPGMKSYQNVGTGGDDLHLLDDSPGSSTEANPKNDILLPKSPSSGTKSGPPWTSSDHDTVNSSVFWRPPVYIYYFPMASSTDPSLASQDSITSETGVKCEKTTQTPIKSKQTMPFNSSHPENGSQCILADSDSSCFQSPSPQMSSLHAQAPTLSPPDNVITTDAPHNQQAHTSIQHQSTLQLLKGCHDSIVPNDLSFRRPGSVHKNVYRTVMIESLPSDIKLYQVMEQVMGGPIISSELLNTLAISKSMTAKVVFYRQADALAFWQYAYIHPLEFSKKAARVTYLDTSPTKPMSYRIQDAMGKVLPTRCLHIRGHLTDHDSLHALRCTLTPPCFKRDWIQTIEDRGTFAEVVFDTVDAAIGTQQRINTWMHAIHGRTPTYSKLMHLVCAFGPDPCDRPLPIKGLALKATSTISVKPLKEDYVVSGNQISQISLLDTDNAY